MSGPARLWLAGALAVSALIAFGDTRSASAQIPISAPVVTLDRYEMAPGDRVVVTVDGFQASTVAISFCGNDGRRGLADCNMTESQGREFNRDDTATLTEMAVAAPPVPCPCLVRVSSRTNDEVAVVPITLIGHPTGPIVGVPGLSDPLAVSLVADPSAGGWLRASLGGTKTYDVKVTIRNRSSEPVDDLGVVGFTGGDGEDLSRRFELDLPDELLAGQTWTGTTKVGLPAPVWGNSVWRVDVTSEGPTVVATDTTSHLPGLLIALIVVLVADLVVLFVRFVVRRRRRWISTAPNSEVAAIDADPTPTDVIDADLVDIDVDAVDEGRLVG